MPIGSQQRPHALGHLHVNPLLPGLVVLLRVDCLQFISCFDKKCMRFLRSARQHGSVQKENNIFVSQTFPEVSIACCCLKHEALPAYSNLGESVRNSSLLEFLELPN